MLTNNMIMSAVIKIMLKILNCWTLKVEWSHPFHSKPHACWEIKDTESSLTRIVELPDEQLEYYVKTYNIVIHIYTYNNIHAAQTSPLPPKIHLCYTFSHSHTHAAPSF